MEFTTLKLIINDPIFGIFLFIIYFIFLIGLNVRDYLYDFLIETRFGIRNIYIVLFLGIGILFNLPYFVSIFKKLGIEIYIIRLPIVLLEIVLVYLSAYVYLLWFFGFMIIFLFISAIVFYILLSIGQIFGVIGSIISFLLAFGIMIYWYGYSLIAVFCRILLTPIDFLLISFSILFKGKIFERRTSLCPFYLF